MPKNVLITGGTGLVGLAIKEISQSHPEYNFFFAEKTKYNLTVEKDVSSLFKEIQPDYVIHTAAKTGGLKKNLVTPAEQYYDNILINSYVVHYSYLHNVKKLLALSSVACYDPRIEILNEEELHFGYPHENFKSYGYTKRMLDIQIDAYNKQYNTNFSSIICSNIFGKNDGFNLEYGHVVPSLIHKCYLAKNKKEFLEIWGDGSASREFIYAKDLASICIKILNLECKIPQRIIVSGESPITIKELVENICKIYNFNKIRWVPEGPSSNLNRVTEKRILKELLPDFVYTNFSESLKETVEWFIKNYPNVRL